MQIRNALLQKGTFVKFQPQSSDFLQISNPKAVLEATLRSFTCLTTGDSIAINYNSKVYWLDVLSVAPNNAISIIEADVNVEFAAPKDYVEPEKPKSVARDVKGKSGSGSGSAGMAGFGGGEDGEAGSRLAKRLEKLKGIKGGDDSSDSSDDEDGIVVKKERFPGSGQTLKAGAGSVVNGASSVAGSVKGDAKAGEREDKKDEKKPFQAFSGQGRTLKG